MDKQAKELLTAIRAVLRADKHAREGRKTETEKAAVKAAEERFARALDPFRREGAGPDTT